MALGVDSVLPRSGVISHHEVMAFNSTIVNKSSIICYTAATKQFQAVCPRSYNSWLYFCQLSGLIHYHLAQSIQQNHRRSEIHGISSYYLQCQWSQIQMELVIIGRNRDVPQQTSVPYQGYFFHNSNTNTISNLRPGNLLLSLILDTSFWQPDGNSQLCVMPKVTVSRSSSLI